MKDYNKEFMKNNIIDFNDIKTPEELYSFMKLNIKYGFVTENKEIHTHKNTPIVEEYEKILKDCYQLQTPTELLISKCGLCYDQVELEKKWFLNNNYKIKTFFTPYHNHAFLIYEDNNKYYLFERTMPDNNGIFSFEDLNEAIEHYKSIQIKKNNINSNDIVIYEYNVKNFALGFYEFINYTTNNNIEENI